MKKGIILFLGAALSSAAAFTVAKVLKRKKQETSQLPVNTDPPKSRPASPFTDYHDYDHLIFCEESELDRRLIRLETSINLRDIGGYTGADGRKTKWGKVFRSEDLSRFSDNDIQWLADRGLKHVYDFRDEKAAKKHPDHLPATADYTNLPVLTGLNIHPDSENLSRPNGINDFFSQVYLFQVREKAQSFATVLKAIAKDETPILYHCTNGKDRTGFMTALILLVCGVPEETIISDYTLTNLTFEKAFDTFGDQMAKDFGIADKRYIRDFFGVNPEWLKLQLRYIRENYDSVDAYLLANSDMTQAELDQVREVMLEK